LPLTEQPLVGQQLPGRRLLLARWLRAAACADKEWHLKKIKIWNFLKKI
jgi:hypothetical protein